MAILPLDTRGLPSPVFFSSKSEPAETLPSAKDCLLSTPAENSLPFFPSPLAASPAAQPSHILQCLSEDLRMLAEALLFAPTATDLKTYMNNLGMALLSHGVRKSWGSRGHAEGQT